MLVLHNLIYWPRPQALPAVNQKSERALDILSGLHLGGGQGTLTPPPLRIATIHVHNIESSPLIDRKRCLNQMFLLILTHELSSALCSMQEGVHPPPAPAPWY